MGEVRWDGNSETMELTKCGKARHGDDDPSGFGSSGLGGSTHREARTLIVRGTRAGSCPGGGARSKACSSMTTWLESEWASKPQRPASYASSRPGSRPKSAQMVRMDKDI